jgi:hypothetical protein
VADVLKALEMDEGRVFWLTSRRLPLRRGERERDLDVMPLARMRERG